MDPTDEFFDKLARRGHDPLLAKASGTARFDITQGATVNHWLISISKGDISVSREDAPADCVIRADRAVFDAIVKGRVYFFAAVLRADIVVEGDPALIMFVQRTFPGAPNAHTQRRPPSKKEVSHG